jgi:hypothetical protein
MKPTRRSSSVAAVILLFIGCAVFYLLSPPSMYLQVPLANIPPPVVVQLTETNSPLRVFPGVGGLLMILPDGSLWRWGQTGPGTWPRAKIPLQIGTNLDWKQAFAANNHSVAVRTDGTLWEWGWRGNDRFSNDPEQVDPDHDWIAVSAGDLHSVALKSDGTLWAWGDNTTFQLGIGPGPSHTNLIQIGTNQDWTGIIGSGSYTLGVQKNGTLWLWGQVYWLPKNRAGTNCMFPTQVNRDTNWVGVALQSALLRGHTTELWNPLFSSPDADAAVSSNGYLLASNWISSRSAIGFAGKLTHYEVRTNGTLWSAPFIVKAGVPKPSDQWRQVGKRSDWISIWGSGTVVGVTSDGTVWTWGADPGQEPVPDIRSRITLWEVQIRRWIGKPRTFWTTQATSPYQKEPRPLMRLGPTNKLQSSKATAPLK